MYNVSAHVKAVKTLETKVVQPPLSLFFTYLCPFLWLLTQLTFLFTNFTNPKYNSYLSS